VWTIPGQPWDCGLLQPHPDACHVNGGQATPSRLLITGGRAPLGLHLVPKPLDEVALLLTLPGLVPHLRAALPRRNHCSPAPRLDEVHQCFWLPKPFSPITTGKGTGCTSVSAWVTSASCPSVRTSVTDKPWPLTAAWIVVPKPPRRRPRASAAALPAFGVRADARRIQDQPLLVRSCTAATTLCQTSLSAQRLKRFQTWYQVPKRCARLRQGAPVLALHNPASPIKRISLAVMQGVSRFAWQAVLGPLREWVGDGRAWVAGSGPPWPTHWVRQALNVTKLPSNCPHDLANRPRTPSPPPVTTAWAAAANLEDHG
jgi:hypothetical protein